MLPLIVMARQTAKGVKKGENIRHLLREERDTTILCTEIQCRLHLLKVGLPWSKTKLLLTKQQRALVFKSIRLAEEADTRCQLDH